MQWFSLLFRVRIKFIITNHTCTVQYKQAHPFERRANATLSMLCEWSQTGASEQSANERENNDLQVLYEAVDRNGNVQLARSAFGKHCKPAKPNGNTHAYIIHYDSFVIIHTKV